MKAKIEVSYEFEPDVLESLKESGITTEEQLKEEYKKALADSLFEIAEDWVLHNIEPNIEFEELSILKKHVAEEL